MEYGCCQQKKTTDKGIPWLINVHFERIKTLPWPYQVEQWEVPTELWEDCMRSTRACS
jgi:hypothetical protein